ncbi:b0-type amino acid transporter 1-like [Tropilaelaps mercedesae]|uniref:B0-type amino acid transporter 1-like n=1 Tax=Tropilaelaps mercedesae TaxID=418985 RepID=A0A1V9X493_9ACAR|nr:b0-type amino acid transporter 1-like [Tropilaelaps mercedesae]
MLICDMAPKSFTPVECISPNGVQTESKQNEKNLGAAEAKQDYASTLVTLPRIVGLWNAIAIVVGAIIGSLCYIELSTVVPASGSEYAFLQVAATHLGGHWNVLPFLCVWCHVCIADSLSTAVLSKTFISYILTLAYDRCTPDELSAFLLAVVFIAFTMALNLTNMLLLLRLQNILSSFKVVVLFAAVAVGLYSSIFNVNQLTNINWFEGSKFAPRDLVSTIYGALWAYSGWKSITCLTEEVENPQRNVPLSIVLGIVLVTVIYSLTNIAFFVVLDTSQILSSDVVAVTFAANAFGSPAIARIVPVLVGLSVFGCFSGHFLSNGRILSSAARIGHLWPPLAQVHIDSGIPVLTMLLRCVLGIVCLSLGSTEQLIELPIFLECVFEAFTVFALILFRWTLPNAKRVYRVPYAFMVLKLALLGYIFYATLTSTKNLAQYLVLAGIVLAGLFVYVVCIVFKCSVPHESRVALFLQKFFLTVPCDNSIIEDLSSKK